MKRFVLLCAAFLVAIPFVAGAVETKTGTTKSGKPRLEATQKVTGEATVLSVNKTKRTVKIKNAAGDTIAVECGPQVKNFDQIHPKDVVTLTYTEKLTIEVEGPGEAGEAAEVNSTTAKPGEKPHATVNGKVQYKAHITAIDKTKGTVTMKGADGDEATVTPRNPANIDKVKVGDVVVFTYTQALAASVTKAAAK